VVLSQCSNSGGISLATVLGAVSAVVSSRRFDGRTYTTVQQATIRKPSR
jgi:hypothetical protein